MKKIIGIIVLGLFLLIGGVLLYLNWGLQSQSQVEITNVDFAALPDGIYEGSHTSRRWSNHVALRVEEGRVVEITIVDPVRLDVPEVKETMIQRVLDAQSLEVELFSGASVTSKAYLKSMEDALRKDSP